MAKCGSKSTTKPKNLGGAPEFPYSEELADEICFAISTSKEKIEKILSSNPRFPKRETFYKWLFNKPGLAERYRIAKEHQQDILVDSQWDEIEAARNSTYLDAQGNNRIDTGAIALARLVCDNIKWDAARKAPLKYGLKDAKDTKNDNDHDKRILEGI